MYRDISRRKLFQKKFFVFMFDPFRNYNLWLFIFNLFLPKGELIIFPLDLVR